MRLVRDLSETCWEDMLYIKILVRKTSNDLVSSFLETLIDVLGKSSIHWNRVLMNRMTGVTGGIYTSGMYNRVRLFIN